MPQSLEHYFLDLIKGKKRGFFPSLLRSILRFLSWGFQGIVACRNWVFDHEWVRKYSPPVPVVISIGNIVAGGTGKTPVTLLLAQEFYGDIPLAILARGYRSKAEKLATPIILSRGEGPMHPASYCGDEPYMLAQNLTKAFVFVGRDRHKASNMAAKAGAQLILLDDGMQHRRLARDFEIVVIDGCNPFGYGYFLPRGLLRESLHALARADLIILNHADAAGEKCHLIRKQLGRYTSAPVVAMKPEVAEILSTKGESISSLAQKRVGIFCGIAHPEYFQSTVEELGAEVVAQYFIGDHLEFDPEQLATFAQKSAEQGAEFLVCTEKDKVKLSNDIEFALPILWVRMRLVFVEGKTHWEAFIKKAKTDLARRL